MAGSPNWTIEEEMYLCEHWGHTSIRGISEHLNRSEGAIILRAQRLKLGAFLDAGDYITVNQLFKALGAGRGDSYKLISWVKNRGLPIKKKKVRNCHFRIIKISDFWKWAHDNMDILDFTKMELYALGDEPEWVAEKRKTDSLRNRTRSLAKWSAVEDQRLEYLLNRKAYTTDQIAEELRRSEGAVVRRISTLKLKTKPLRNSPHTNWTTQELALLRQLISDGHNYQSISREIPRHSEKAIRGKVYLTFCTENLDKVRRIIKEEKNNAP